MGMWRALGHDASLTVLTPDGTVPDVPDTTVIDSSGRLNRLGATRAFAVLLAGSDADAVYVRYDLFAPPLRPDRDWPPVIVELNTDDRSEFKLRGRTVALYNGVNRRALIGHSTGAIFVSQELSRADSFALAPPRRLVLGNGVDLERVRPSPVPDNLRPRLVFVGYPSPWQAVDKVIRLARALPEADIEIVGFSREELGETTPNVVAHGRLRPSEVSTVLGRCDIGIGTLGLHRKSMDETSPLKVREYLSYGLPTIIGNRDTDFLQTDPWFLLEIPNTEDNVEQATGRIREFVAAVKGRRVARVEIANLDLRAKEIQRLAFIAEVAGLVVEAPPTAPSDRSGW
jgi:glycosyltransferase involved in cell wall biosynthesis